MSFQHRRSGSRLRMEIPEALLDASPAPPHGSHDDAGTGSSNPLPSSGESRANLTSSIRGFWGRPELVVEVKYLTWTDDNLLRQVVYEGLREDKLATEVRREVPRRGS